MSIRQAAYSAARGYNMLKGIINSELKRYDGVISQNIPNTYSVVCLNQIAAGDDALERDGNSILAKYLTIKYNLVMGSSAIATLVRIMCLVDSQNQGSTPTQTDVFGSLNPLIAPVNIDSTQRFTVLFDDHVNLSNNGTRTIFRKHYKKLNFHIRYTSTSSTSFNKNSIFLIFLSNEAEDTPAFDMINRIAFYDN